MLNTRIPKRNTGCRKVGHLPQCLQFATAICIRSTNH